MKPVFILFGVGLLLVSGCSKEHKVEHSLNCVVSSVVYNQTGNMVKIKREDAIKNGFVYHLSLYDDGRLVVNDMDIYVKDKEIDRSYSLQRGNRVDTNMKFQFTEEFDDVKFILQNRNEEFNYDCSPK